MEAFLPNITGLGEVESFELEGVLPDGLTFGVSSARSAHLDGGFRGTPLNATQEPVNLTVWANNSNYQYPFALMITVFNDTDNDSIPDYLPENYTGNLTADDDDDDDGWYDQDELNCGSDPLDADSNPTNTDGEFLYWFQVLVTTEIKMVLHGGVSLYVSSCYCLFLSPCCYYVTRL